MHALDGSDAVGQVERQVLLALLLVQVDVGVEEAGQQVASLAFDHGGAGGRLEGAARAEVGDPSVLDDHGVVEQQALGVHGDDVDVDEGEGAGRVARGRRAAED